MATNDSTSTKAYSNVTMEKCSLVWVINQFSDVGNKALKSPVFSKEGGTLLFVLNLETSQQKLNSDEFPKAYIRVYLTVTSKNITYDTPVLRCVYQFDFKKSDGSLFTSKSGNTDSFEYGNETWGNKYCSKVGYENCIDKKTLTNSLINDVLEIHVHVTASVSVATTAFLPTASVKVPNTTTALFDTRKFSDFVIRVRETDILVHKCVLALKSSVFEAMLLHDTSEAQLGVLELNDMDLATVHAMIEFFYLDAVNKLSVALALDLLRVADKYNVVDLVRYCSNYLQENVCFSNVIDILVTASDSNASELKEFCFKYIAENKSFELDDEQKKKLEQQKDLLIHLQHALKKYCRCSALCFPTQMEK